MIRLLAGLIALGAVLTVPAAGDVSVSPEQAHSNVAPHSASGERGISTSSAFINLSEVAQAEAKAPKKSQVKSARKAMSAPKGLLGGAQNVAQASTLQNAIVAATSLSPATGVNFLGAPDNGNFIPPDTMGAVGTSQIMNTVNGEVRITDRTGRFLSSVTLDAFWAKVGPFSSNGTFDPKVYFDGFNSRWITVCSADAESSASSVLIGVSKTSDALGGWNLYRIDADSTDTYWADYPSVGQNGRWIVVSMNMFPNSFSGQYGGVFMWLFDKAELYNGPAQAQFTKFAEPSGFTMAPATTFDSTEQTLYILETFDAKSLRLSTITGAEGQEKLNTGVAIINSPVPWNTAGGQLGQQSGGSAVIDCNDTRILSCVVRNGSIWGSHSVFVPANSAPTRAIAQWWQVTTDGKIIQRATIDDGTSSYAMPTLGVNRNNDMLIGYTRFNVNMFATAAYSFRAGSDPVNALQSEATLKAGEGFYFKDFGSGENRWGDYSATMPDPVNDQDLWTVQEYAAAPRGGESQWGTWWGMISLSQPPDGVLEVRVSPASQTEIAQGQANSYFATVTDSYLQINDATVVAKIAGRPDVTFRNDGIAPDAVANDNVYTGTLTLNSPAEGTVVFTASKTGMTSGSTTNTYLVIPRPANDNFTNATKIPASGIFGLTTAEVQNNFATSEQGEPLHAGVSNARSLWWNYSPSASGPVLVDTSGTGPDVVIAVYTGSSLSSLFAVASTNPPVGKQAYLTFDAQAGITYRIAIAGANDGEKGLVRLRVQPNGQPDTTPPVVTVDFPPSGLATNVTAITFSGTAIDPAPNASGVNAVLIHVLDVEPETVIPATLNGTTWSASVPLPNATNEFRVTGVDFANNVSEGNLIVVYYRNPTSTNDLFGQPRVLTPPSGVDFASNTNATTEFNEPLHGGNEGGHSLWWTYTPPSDGILLLSTAGSDFDTLLGLYTVNDPVTDKSFSKLITVAENDDSRDRTDGTSEIAAAVQGGRLYYIAVDGYGGDTGNVRLEYTFQKTAVFPLTVSATGGGSISPSNGDFPSGSAVTVIATPDKYRQFSKFIVNQNGVVTEFTAAPRYTFVMNGPTSVSAEFVTKQFADDFQTGDFSKLPYQISSSAAVGQHWIVASVETNSVTHESSLVARVRPNLPDSTAASLVLVTNLAAGVGSFEFSINTETNYDRFEFSVNGAIVGTWSGFIPWQTFSFDIPATNGPTRLEWRFTKDVALGPKTGDELVAIDNLDVTTVPPPAQVPPTLTIGGDSTQATIIATGTPFADFVLETSTDLKTWAPVAGSERNAGSSGVVTYIQSASAGAHFYRVRQL